MLLERVTPVSITGRFLMVFLCVFLVSFCISPGPGPGPDLAMTRTASARSLPVKNPHTGISRIRIPRIPVPRIPALKSWGYQLQNIRPAKIARAPHDLMVIDFSRDGSGRRMFSRKEIARMKRKPDGSRRILLAYLSIGEAENYRDYWKKKWRRKRSRPAWLGKENPDWKGNYSVKYWYRKWQGYIYGRPGAYLDRIMKAGFDGVYLDKIDSYEDFPKRRSAAKDMIRFVSALGRYANRRRKFYIMGQNAEGLSVSSRFRNSISAIGKEDLLYGINHDGKKNRRSEIAWSKKYLKIAQKAGLTIFAVEYIRGKARRARTAARLKKLGMVPFFSSRSLDRLEW